MNGELLLQALPSALFAGLVAIGVTLAVERLGGLVGGIVGTLPTTIVPAAFGIHAQATDEAFVLAMYAVAPGMFVSALFLWVWGVLPPRLPTRHFGVRLVSTTMLSLLLWLAGASFIVLMLRERMTTGTAIGTLLTLALTGLVVTARTQPAPRVSRRVGPGVLVARGLAAALAIGVAVILAARGGDVVAGVVSVFPAIFLTTMVALWLAHGEAVPGAAVGPMMVGSTSVAAYALVASWSLPALGAALGSFVAWLVAALAVQLPLFFAARAAMGRFARVR